MAPGTNSRQCCFYALVFFGVGWVQFTANVFVYILVHDHHDDLGGSAMLLTRDGRFPLTSNNNNNPKPNPGLRSGRAADGATRSQPQSLEVQLLELRTRLGKVKKLLEKELDENNNNNNNNNNTNRRTTFKNFVPFAIRDAQRTVPTQIPHGFEVFDFIDLYATNGEQNQTDRRFRNLPSYDHDEDYNIAPTTTAARLFRNGEPVSETAGGENDNDGLLLSGCADYSKECYRTKMLRVIRYLLFLNDDDDEDCYYFYMEADNDLCVPLGEIRDLAHHYQRYFVSTGVGASGWIMSRKFLEDFYQFWKSVDVDGNGEADARNNNINDHDGRYLLTRDERLEPDSVARALLQTNNNNEKMNQTWSVTRRYLTSHSILVASTEDAVSIAALFEREDGTAADLEHKQGGADEKAEKEKEAKKAPKGGATAAASKKIPMAPPLVPARYLPRCLEPHRGVWWREKDPAEGDKSEGGVAANKNNRTSHGFDARHHWEFFDYGLCPESDIFPCQEGRLESPVEGKDGAETE